VRVGRSKCGQLMVILDVTATPQDDPASVARSRVVTHPASAITHSVPSSRGIDSLTGIRGVAAVWVFLTHYQAVMVAYIHSPAIQQSSFLYNGFRGVDLFFVLSGFILMHVHGEDFRAFHEATFWRFYVLRFFRVYPLNTVVLLALLPIGLAMPELVTWFRTDHGIPIPYHNHDFSAAGFVQSLFLAQTWSFFKPGEWNGPAWSLSAEVFGYAIFPLLAHFLIWRRSALACAANAFINLAILMALLALFNHTRDSPTGTFGLVRMIFGFIAGMSMARCFQLLHGAIHLGQPVALVSCAFIVGAIALPAGNMFVVFGFCGLIFALAFQQGPIDAALSSGPAMFMGRISFSFYMIHYVPLKISIWLAQTTFADSGLSTRIFCLVSVAGICLVLAVITYRYVERPLQRYARSVSMGSRGVPGHAIGAKA
jgi:peptidoglycan/LPS O-acetylase OafA/YrhL